MDHHPHPSPWRARLDMSTLQPMSPTYRRKLDLEVEMLSRTANHTMDSMQVPSVCSRTPLLCDCGTSNEYHVQNDVSPVTEPENVSRHFMTTPFN